MTAAFLLPRLSPPDRKVVNESVLAWRTVAAEQPANPVAKDMLERLLMPKPSAGFSRRSGGK